MLTDTIERLAIRDVLESWIVWSDSGDWERFRDVWHEDGRMMATWFQGNRDEFVAARRDAFDNDVMILHSMGSSSIDLAGDRAIAQSRMNIMQRGPVHGVECDVICVGRFYDFFEKRDGRWAIVLRQPIYEKDRLDPIDPSQPLKLDPDILARFPQGYRHLAYLQTVMGYDVKTDMPGLKGPEVTALYTKGARWLAGETL
jgi:hypothetical protein